MHEEISGLFWGGGVFGAAEPDRISAAVAPAGPVLAGPNLSEWPGPGGVSYPDSAAWVRGFGVQGQFGSNPQETGMNFTQAGVLLGFEHRLNPCAFVGFTGGVHTTDANALDILASAHSDGFELGVYGAYRLGENSYLLGSSLYTHSDISPACASSISAPSRRPRAVRFPEAATLAIWKRVNTCARRGLAVDPLASLEYDRVNQGGFNETGAGALDLSEGGSTADALLVSVGARIWDFHRGGQRCHFHAGDATALRPRFRRRQPEGGTQTCREYPRTVFAVTGIRAERDYALAGFSRYRLNWSTPWRTYVSYNGQFASGQTVQVEEAGLRYRF